MTHNVPFLLYHSFFLHLVLDIRRLQARLKRLWSFSNDVSILTLSTQIRIFPGRIMSENRKFLASLFLERGNSVHWGRIEDVKGVLSVVVYLHRGQSIWRDFRSVFHFVRGPAGYSFTYTSFALVKFNSFFFKNFTNTFQIIIVLYGYCSE